MYIKDLVTEGYLMMTVPDNPKSAAQKYVTTEKGSVFKMIMMELRKGEIKVIV